LAILPTGLHYQYLTILGLYSHIFGVTVLTVSWLIVDLTYLIEFVTNQ